MSPPTKKTVAAISFHDNKNLSIDIENVSSVYVGTPQQMTEEIWFVDLIIHSDVGNVSLQLTADNLENLKPIKQEKKSTDKSVLKGSKKFWDL